MTKQQLIYILTVGSLIFIGCASNRRDFSTMYMHNLISATEASRDESGKYFRKTQTDVQALEGVVHELEASVERFRESIAEQKKM
jgi:hypothetical protein